MQEPTICFGVDVHQDELVVRAIDKTSGQEVGPLMRMRNNRLGADQLVDWLCQMASQSEGGPARLEGGLEATGILWLPVYTYLMSQASLQAFHFHLTVFNPKLISDWKQGIHLAPDKDDPHDAKGIAQRVRYGSLPAGYVPTDFWQGVRRLTRYRLHLSRELNREQNRFANHVYLKISDWHRVKPFSDLQGATSAALLTQYSRQDLAAFSTSQLAEVVDRLGRHAFADPDAVARQVQQALSQSYPVSAELEEAVTLALKAQYDHIRDLEKRLASLDKQIAHLTESVPNPLRSIKGIGPVLSAGILAEIADIRRFPDQAALAKYAGLFWRRHASGHFEAEDRRLAKVGNPYLRYYLGLGANELRRYNPEYQAYYRRKYEESSKHKHKRALTFASRKLVRLVYALLTKNVDFVARPAAHSEQEVQDLSWAA